MQHKSFRKHACPIARSLERVGEWWSMLIMRDALFGLRRFDEFQKTASASRPICWRDGSMRWSKPDCLERHRYSAHPPRMKYRPTQRGRDFRPVLIALLAFGNRHLPRKGRA